MPKRSAGILMYQRDRGELRVLLVHPGGPFWKNRDAGAWSIPKGEIEPGDEAEATARREFEEELGTPCDGALLELGEITQQGGKHVIAFAMERDFDVASLRSNTFEMEWPPRSGKMQAFPEVDRAEWMDLVRARAQILPAQREFLARLQRRLS